MVRIKPIMCLVGHHKFGRWNQPAYDWWERVRVCERCGKTEPGIAIGSIVYPYRIRKGGKQ